jgi:hypothetical protein
VLLCAAAVVGVAAVVPAPVSADTGYGNWRSSDRKHAVVWQAQYAMVPKSSVSPSTRDAAVRLDLSFIRQLHQGRPNAKGATRSLYGMPSVREQNGWWGVKPDGSGSAPEFVRVTVPSAVKDPRTGQWVSWSERGAVRYRICFSSVSFKETCTAFDYADNWT